MCAGGRCAGGGCTGGVCAGGVCAGGVCAHGLCAGGVCACGVAAICESGLWTWHCVLLTCQSAWLGCGRGKVLQCGHGSAPGWGRKHCHPHALTGKHGLSRTRTPHAHLRIMPVHHACASCLCMCQTQLEPCEGSLNAVLAQEQAARHPQALTSTYPSLVHSHPRPSPAPAKRKGNASPKKWPDPQLRTQREKKKRNASQKNGLTLTCAYSPLTLTSAREKKRRKEEA